MNREIWDVDFVKVTDALAPYTIEVDGVVGVSPSAPEGLVSAYRGLLSIGYANGWVEGQMCEHGYYDCPWVVSHERGAS